jgi:hypothetical protein
MSTLALKTSPLGLIFNTVIMESQSREVHLIQRLLWTAEDEATEIASDLVQKLENGGRRKLIVNIRKQMSNLKKYTEMLHRKQARDNKSLWSKKLDSAKLLLERLSRELQTFEEEEQEVRRRGQVFILSFYLRTGLHGREFDDYQAEEVLPVSLEALDELEIQSPSFSFHAIL